MSKQYYSKAEFDEDVEKLIDLIPFEHLDTYKSIYAVPQGGIPLGQALSILLGIPLLDPSIPLKDFPKSTLIVDDIVDSGATRARFEGFDFAALHVKPHASVFPDWWIHETSNWIVYWWEGSEEKSLEDSIIRMLEFIGENPNREGLEETPKRVIMAWNEIFSGYGKSPEEVVKVFSADGYDQLVLIKDIEVYSMCEHHILPFFGRAHVGYIPNGKLIGASKLARLVEIFARRLQIQERLTDQVTNSLMEMINPIGAGCVVEADHLCMRMRGVGKQNSTMVTSSLKGCFLEDSDTGRAARAELMGLLKS